MENGTIAEQATHDGLLAAEACTHTATDPLRRLVGDSSRVRQVERPPLVKGQIGERHVRQGGTGPLTVLIRRGSQASSA